MNEKLAAFLRSAGRTLVVYLMWFGLAALAVLVMMQAREAITSLFRLFTLNRWIIGAIDRFGIFILGLVVLIVILVEENYLREGAAEGKLLRRFGTLLAGTALAYGIAYAIDRISLRLLVR